MKLIQLTLLSTNYAKAYGPAIRSCLIWQVSLGLLAALTLDQGQTARACSVALLCHWSIILIILHRRPLNPSRLDLAIVQHGFLPLIAIIMTFGPWFLRLMGTPASMIP
jgi:hypothetical protein